MTEQEQSRDPNNTLKEILGFDPETGDRVVDNPFSNTTDPNVKVPVEVQELFLSKKNAENTKRTSWGARPSVLKIVPDRLFTVEREEVSDYGDYDVIYRNYYVWNEEPDVGLKISLLSSLGIKLNQFYLEEMIISSETESVGLCFKIPGNINIRLIKSGVVSLDIDYEDLVDKNLKMAQILLDPAKKGRSTNFRFVSEQEKWHHEYYGQQDYDGVLGREMKIRRYDSVISVEKGKSGYVFRINTAHRIIELILPEELSSAKLVGEIAGPELLKNPIDAPLELDDTWRILNLSDFLENHGVFLTIKE